VKEVDFTYDRNRILFHFTHASEKFDEWIDYGSPRICAFQSKVVRGKKGIPQQPSGMSMAKQISAEAASISKALLAGEQAAEIEHCKQTGINEEHEDSYRHVSEASDTTETRQCDATSLTTPEQIESPASEVSGTGSFDLVSDSLPTLEKAACRDQEMSHSATIEQVEKRTTDAVSLSSNVWLASRDVPSSLGNLREMRGYAGDMNASSSTFYPIHRNMPVDQLISNDYLRRVDTAYVPQPHEFGSLGPATRVQGINPRAPDFITSTRTPSFDYEQSGRFPDQRFWGATPTSAHAASAVGLSGLDILAAVTNRHVLGSSNANGGMALSADGFQGFGHALPRPEDQPAMQQQSSMGYNSATDGALFNGSQFGWQ
jgi:hypothetical protein